MTYIKAVFSVLEPHADELMAGYISDEELLIFKTICVIV
jgi:hypothetical protein